MKSYNVCIGSLFERHVATHRYASRTNHAFSNNQIDLEDIELYMNMTDKLLRGGYITDLLYNWVLEGIMK